jgi:hypothetical protein
VAGLHLRFGTSERYLFYHNNFNEYVKLKERAACFQLNLLAVVGYYGSKLQK